MNNAPGAGPTGKEGSPEKPLVPLILKKSVATPEMDRRDAISDVQFWNDYSILIGTNNVYVFDEHGVENTDFQRIGSCTVNINWADILKDFIANGKRWICLNPSGLAEEIYLDDIPFYMQSVARDTLQRWSSNRTNFNSLPQTTQLGNLVTEIIENGKYIVIMDKYSGCFKAFQTEKNGQKLDPQNWIPIMPDHPQNLPAEIIKFLEGRVNNGAEFNKKIDDQYAAEVYSDRLVIRAADGSKVFEDNISSISQNVCIDPHHPKVIYYCKSNAAKGISRLDLGGDPARWKPKVAHFANNGEYSINNLTIDPSGNFFLCNCYNKGLVLFERSSLTEVKVTPVIADANLGFDSSGRIRTLNQRGQMVAYDNNLDDINRELQQKRANKIAAGLEDADLFNGQNGHNLTEQEREQRHQALLPIKERNAQQFLERIGTAASVADLESLYAPLSVLEDRLRAQQVSEEEIAYVTGDIRKQLDDMIQAFVTDEIGEVAETFREHMAGLDVIGLGQLETYISDLNKAIRRGTDYRQDTRELSVMRDQMETALKRKWESNKGELMEEINQRLQDVLVRISEIEEISTLRNFRDDNREYVELVTQLEKFRKQIGSEEISKIKGQINQAIENKRETLKAKEAAREQAREKERLAHIADIEKEIESLDGEIHDSVSQPLQMERFISGSDHLRRIRQAIEMIPDEQDQKKMTLILDRMISRHTVRVQNAEVLRTSRDGQHAIFGAEKFIKHEPGIETNAVTWEIGFDIEENPANPNKDKFTFYFESSEGERRYTHEMLQEMKTVCGPVKIPTVLYRRDYESNQDNPDFYLNRVRTYLNQQSHSTSILERIPQMPPDLIFSQEIIESLEKMSKFSKMQLGLDRNGVQTRKPQGMLLLEGDTGTGKDILIDIFAAMTNRPLFVFDCSQWTQRGEFTYTYEFNGRTIKVESEVQKALQTPGAILYFNEFNQLDQSAQKYLNSLLSHRRQIRGAFNSNRPTRDDVLIYGSMNGRKGYHGVEVESSSVSRIRYLEVDYMRERLEVWGCDQDVLAARKMLVDLKDLSDEDFRILWDYAVNKKIDETKRQHLAVLATMERLSSITLLKNTLLAQGKLKVTESLWNHSEAYAMAKLCRPFAKMREEEFKTTWDYLINNKTNNGGASLVDQNRRKILIAFKLVIQVANDIRRQFRKTHSGEDVNEGEEVKFIASLREIVECAKEIDYVYDMFENGEDLAVYVLREVIMPKIPRPAERIYLETLFTQGVKTLGKTV